MRKLVGLFVLLLMTGALALVAGCGGDDEGVSLEEWAGSYTSLCLQGVAALEELEPVFAEAASPEELADAIERSASIFREFDEGVEALPVPSEEQEMVEELLELNAAGSDFAEALADAVSVGDEGEIARILAAVDEADSRAKEIERALGVDEECVEAFSSSA